MNSYEGRYFYLAVVIVVSLLTITLFGNRYVNKVSWQQITRITDRTAVNDRLDQMLESVDSMEALIYQQLMEPGSVGNTAFANATQNLSDNLLHLSKTPLHESDQVVQRTVETLSGATNGLTEKIERFETISSDIQNRFHRIGIGNFVDQVTVLIRHILGDIRETILFKNVGG